MMFTRPTAKTRKTKAYSTAAEKNREAAGKRSRANYAKLAEVGPLPAVKNPKRKAACRTDLHRFLVEYFPNSTGLKPFGDDQKHMIARLQQCILFGGLMAIAMFRGAAKSSIGECACLWGGVYGHRLFIQLIAADNDAADKNLESIKYELAGNELLYEDFPEICHAVRALEGRNQRTATQTIDGRLTHLGWTAREVIFPTIPGAPSSGVCIRPQSLMSYSRGNKHKLIDGRQIRPDFFLLDDPQTDESASSPAQVEKRLSKLNRAVLKSAGHSKSLAGFLAGTIIEKDDMVDQLLDSAKNPQWAGERVKMVKAWSDAHESFWLTKYKEILHGWNRAIPADKERAKRDAMLLYKKHRAEADAGCKVAWEHCYSDNPNDYEISAIQHAYNMLLNDGPEVFASECQNEPPDRTQMQADAIEPDDVLARAIGPARRIVPAWAGHLTAFVDVQANMLWYAVGAFADDFTGTIIDYGSYPDQARTYYTKSDVKKTFATAKAGVALEAQVRAALDNLASQILSSTWQREDGAAMDVELLLVDEGFLTPQIYEFCRRSTYASRIMPAKGMAIGAKSKPFEEYQKRDGETLGEHWRRVKVGGNSIRHIIHNPNYWKTRIWNQLRVPVGTRGALTIHQGSASSHRMLADHIATAEAPTRVTANGRTVDEWVQTRGRDNDLFDCVSGCAVAASILGCTLRTAEPLKVKGKPRKRRATGAWAK